MHVSIQLRRFVNDPPTTASGGVDHCCREKLGYLVDATLRCRRMSSRAGERGEKLFRVHDAVLAFDAGTTQANVFPYHVFGHVLWPLDNADAEKAKRDEFFVWSRLSPPPPS